MGTIEAGVVEKPVQDERHGCFGRTGKSRYVTCAPRYTRKLLLMTAGPIVAHWIYAIIAPYNYLSARRCERIVVRHLHQLVQLPSPNAHVPAIEQRQYERVSEQGCGDSLAGVLDLDALKAG